MRKQIILLNSLLSLFLLLSFSSNCLPANAQSTNTNLYPEIESITIDKEMAVIGCPETNRPIEGSGCGPDGHLIKVAVKTTASDEKNFSYFYEVSGGKIVGEGANVIWDLSNTDTGKYAISAGIL